MHRAVAARLSNPELSLFDALHIGGFNYPTNDDSSMTDSEKVTLGQRKNQLSRRLRLARKHQKGAANMNSPHFPLSGFNPGQPQEDVSSRTSSSSKIAALALQMKNNMPELGELSDDANDMTEESPNKKPRAAKFHPDYAPVFVPRSGRNPFQQNPLQPNTMPLNPQQSFGSNPNTSNVTGMSPMNPSFSQVMNNVGNSFPQNPWTQHHFGGVFNPQITTPKVSAVAISSLTNSAQMAGMTLEQLAITLSNNPLALAKVVTGDNSSDSLEKQKQLALSLHEAEAQTLYTKCLIMSGMEASLCGPKTPLYLDFALNAWQEEGRRLQELVRLSRSFREPPLTVGGEETDEKLDDATEDAHASSHSHSHSHDHHDDGKSVKVSDSESHSHDHSTRHLHRLDGQCGHKAIIHNPKDGVAHIDFVIGKTIECYHGIQPIGKNNESVWPSKYKCKEIDSCSKQCAKLNPSEPIPEPKVIPLSDINLQDPEWNCDITGTSLDGGLMGLFKLGETPDEFASL